MLRVAVLVHLLKDDRRAADERLRKEQEKVDKALQAARNAGDKDREVKELAAQLHSLTVCCCIKLRALRNSCLLNSISQ